MDEWNEELDRLYEFANVRYEVGWDNLIDEFELGGIIHSETFLVTKLVGLKFLGSTISEFTLVKILNSLETLASYPKDERP